MKAVIQRVSQASVEINNRLTGEIQKGLLVYLGIKDGDSDTDLEWIVKKISGMRIFPDENGLMNLDVKQADGGILLVSQFTLIAKTKKGTRPSFSNAARPEAAIPVYEKCIHLLSDAIGKPVHTGEFGADMKVSSVNDGPVTIVIDSATTLS